MSIKIMNGSNLDDDSPRRHLNRDKLKPRKGTVLLLRSIVSPDTTLPSKFSTLRHLSAMHIVGVIENVDFFFLFRSLEIYLSFSLLLAWRWKRWRPSSWAPLICLFYSNKGTSISSNLCRGAHYKCHVAILISLSPQPWLTYNLSCN